MKHILGEDIPAADDIGVDKDVTSTSASTVVEQTVLGFGRNAFGCFALVCSYHETNGFSRCEKRYLLSRKGGVRRFPVVNYNTYHPAASEALLEKRKYVYYCVVCIMYYCVLLCSMQKIVTG